MTFCGHVIADDITVKEMVGENGNVVTHFLINAQGIIMNAGLESMVALLNFDEQNQLCYINYVSTIQDKLYNVQNQFVYDFKGNTSLVSSKYAGASAKSVTREENLQATVAKASLIKGVQAPVSSSLEKPENQALITAITFIAIAVVCFVLARAIRRAKNEKK